MAHPKRIQQSLLVVLVLSTSALAHAQTVQRPVEPTEQLDASDLSFVFQPDSSATQPATPSREDAAARAARRSTRSEYVRLARMPNMFGDSMGIGGGWQALNLDQQGAALFASDLPLGAGRNYRIAENNKPIPMDRVFFVYNGFRNAMTSSTTSLFNPNAGAVFQDHNVDMYTMGFEKTFQEGESSVEVRLPVMNSYFVSSAETENSLGFGNVGDLSLFLKHLLYWDGTTAVAAGLGVGLPLAPDIKGEFYGTPWRIHTDAVHLMPYVGGLWTPDDRWFVQGFLQLDFATNGNPIELPVAFATNPVLTEQTLATAHLSVGRWIYQDESARRLSGIATVLELHYSTTVQDADVVTSGLVAGGSSAVIGNTANRLDILNLTSGLHFQLGDLSNLRVACVVPLREGSFDRLFDSEIQVSFNRYF